MRCFASSNTRRIRCFPMHWPPLSRVGSEAQQAAAVGALGRCSLDNCGFLPDELKALQEECTADRKVRGCCHHAACLCTLQTHACHVVDIHTKLMRVLCALQSKQTRMRHTEIRVAIAHVLRLLVSSLPPGALQSVAALRTMVLDHISSSHRYLKSVASGAQLSWCNLRMLMWPGRAVLLYMLSDCG
jgi:hypothetical protein